MFRYSVTDRQVILSIIQAIATHPLIKDPPIYPPIQPVGSRAEPIRITKYRAFAGPELIEAGLTLSVYPTYRANAPRKSIRFTDHVIGQADYPDYSQKASHDITIELSLQDASFDIPFTVSYDELSQRLPGVAHGRQISSQHPKDSQLYNSDLEGQVRNKSLEISILPAEEILREYTTLVRAIVRDIETFSPWMFRNPTVVDVVYGSTEIFDREPRNIIFHKSYIHIEVDSYESALARDFSYLRPIYRVGVDSPIQNIEAEFDYT